MMHLQSGQYILEFAEGGLRVTKKGEILYFNHRPIYLFVKTALAVTEFYDKAYSNVCFIGDNVAAKGTMITPSGSELDFYDLYEAADSGYKVSRKVTVIKAGDDYGFATKFSLVLAASDSVEDYNYFAPGWWYKNNEYAPDTVMGKDMSSEYFWRMETNFTLPLFAAQNKASGEAASFSRWAADATMRSTDFVHSSNTVDPIFSIGALGISRPENKTLNLLYYGFPVRKEIPTVRDGLSIDYVYPGMDGEMPRKDPGYNLDYMMHTKTVSRVFHPMEAEFTQEYAVVVNFGRYEGFYPMMRDTWRKTYDRLRDLLFDVDNEKHYRNCMKLLTKYTRQYGDSWGLPFSCQLPQMDVSSVSFQFGFVGQQPGIGYQLIRFGDMEGIKESYDKGMNIIDFWVRTAMTDIGAPMNCYNPAIEGFEPYPFWTRMIADGLEAILDAYVYLKKKDRDRPGWLEFCRKSADWLVRTQNKDGSFYRAYNTDDGSMRMDSKANTTSVIRFLIQFYLVTKDERYKAAALRAGEWCFENTYKNFEYRGSTCDKAAILDNESGIYAMFAFQALYDLTEDEKWVEPLVAAADFTETWTFSWAYPIRTLWPHHPFNKYTISGQSIVAVGGIGGDVYMAACSYAYYRLYLITGDRHYLNFAEFIHNNTRQCNDTDGSIGYAMTGLGHESGAFAGQTMGGHYHWLPWCTYVEVDPTARLYDTFGSYDIAGCERNAPTELAKRNRIYDTYYDIQKSRL